jgi:hypothetical protein
MESMYSNEILMSIFIACGEAWSIKASGRARVEVSLPRVIYVYLQWAYL